MTVDHAIDTCSGYSSQDKVDLLLHLAHALSILARDAYEVGSDGLTDPPRLRRINELQHRVLSILMALRKNDEKRYPDDILVRLILEHPEDLELQQQLQDTFSNVMVKRSTTG